MQQARMSSGGAPIDPARDYRRFNGCQPGALVYSARMDDNKLICLQRSRYCCCAPEESAKRAYVDAYTNAVIVNAPFVLCCCISCDNAVILHYDHPIFGNPVLKGDFCKPYPYLCPHCCGICGDTLAFSTGTCGCPTSGFGHRETCIPCCCVPLFPTNWVMGLALGEGDIAAMIINGEVAKFRTSGGRFLEMESLKIVNVVGGAPVTGSPAVNPMV